jgi:archaetidylinositol phosphate synthase
VISSVHFIRWFFEKYFVLNNLRDTLKPALEKMGRGFAATGLSPNFWTAVGLGFALLSAVVYGMGVEFGLIIGGVLLLVSGFFDMVDGQVARVTGKTSKKGSYLDSMFDKIAEVAIFLGILVGGYAEPYLVFLAITLSLLVSYARAKSDIINVKLQGIGIGERAERLLVIAIIGIIGFMDYAVIIVVIIAGITLIQRMIVTTKNIKED